MTEEEIKSAIEALKADPRGVDDRVIAILDGIAAALADKADENLVHALTK